MAEYALLLTIFALIILVMSIKIGRKAAENRRRAAFSVAVIEALMERANLSKEEVARLRDLLKDYDDRKRDELREELNRLPPDARDVIRQLIQGDAPHSCPEAA